MLATQKDCEIEQQYFNLNFLSLLEGNRSTEEIYTVAKAANVNRLRQQEGFKQYLSQVGSLSAPEQISHVKLNFEKLSSLLNTHQGCVLALCHMGKHRNIITDLVLSDYKVVAPIAGRSYWDFYEAKSRLLPTCGNNLTLLEVEKKGIGLSLIRASRKAEVAVIYVDGNMGPDGHHVEEGATEVDFCGRNIRVKCGIARLAKLLKRPILPVFSMRNTEDDFTLEFGTPICNTNSLSADQADAEVMQQIYNQLAARFLASPADWEYGLCFHRWLVPKAQNNYLETQAIHLDPETPFKFNSAEYTSLEIGNLLYIVNIETHRAFKLPFQVSLEKILKNDSNGKKLTASLKEQTALDTATINQLINEMIKKRIVVAANSTH